MTTKSDAPSKQSAEQVLQAHGPHPFVRRLNRKAIFILLFIVSLVFAGRMIMGLFERQARIADDERERARLRGHEDMAERIVGPLPSAYDYFRPQLPPKPEPPQEVEAQSEPTFDPDELNRFEAEEAARNSPIQFVNSRPMNPNSQPSASVFPSVQPDYQGQLEPSHDGQRNRPYDDRRRDFFRHARNDSPYVRHKLEPPRSPYEIKAGITIIPAALVTAINSDLPGDVIGQVTTDIYDSLCGRFLLIPQGTRLIGRYDSEVLKGHNRVLIAWQRLILPNGYSINLEAMPGTDGSGVAGMTDKVDWHAKRLVGATLLSTLISLGGNYAANINPEKQELSVLGETVAEDAARVGQRVIDRELDLPPTILIRAGTPFNVLVVKDLEMIPYVPVITRR